MRTIPEIREALHAIAERPDLRAYQPGLCEELKQLAEETKRRKAVRVTRRRAKPLTQNQIDRIKYLAATTDMSYHQIAMQLNVNSGRISEALVGKREDA